MLKAREVRRRGEDDSLQITTLKVGDATHYPEKYDSLAVHYTCYLEDGTCIDNSYNRGQSTNFVLGAGVVIKGWENVFLSGLVSKGQKIRVTIPSQLAYGEDGYPHIIPPNAILTYEIELLTFSSIDR